MTPSRVSVFALLVLLVASGAALAQSGPAVATLVRTEGVVYLNDQPVAGGGTPIALTGDVARIRTDAGRAMVSLKRGGILALADRTSVSVQANGGLNFNKIEVVAGSAVVISASSSPLLACGNDVRLSSGGVFRFDVLEPERADGSARCGFRVYEGAGSTPSSSGAVYVLRDGQRMTLNRRAGDMIPVLSFVPAELDEFDRWSRHQATAPAR